MPDRWTILAPILLVGQAVLVHWGVGLQRTPTAPALSTFPSSFGEWKLLNEDPIAVDAASELHADQILSRNYLRQSTASSANLFVAWFQSQRAGTSQPHSPKVCLPASGWRPALAGEITLNTAAGTIIVNRYIVVKRAQRDVVLYWYQTPRRVTSGEWESKLWLLSDALRDRRTDTALVRIVVASSDGADEAATAAAASFAQGIYPLLREKLPR